MSRLLCLLVAMTTLAAVEEARSGTQLSICFSEPMHHIILGPSLWTFAVLAFAAGIVAPALAAVLVRCRGDRRGAARRRPPSAT
jgi:hypothetical protein